MPLRRTLLAAVALSLLALAPQARAAPDKVVVAYFLEWPTANQAAQFDGTYDEALGVPVEWRAYSNGNEMTEAMVAGEVDIAYAQGFVPFVVGVTEGAPIRMVGVAMTYSDNDACIVRDGSGITKENARKLEGERVATSIGNVTHYKLLKSMEVLGVDASKVELVEMNPAEAAVALVRGDVPMACAFGGALDRMKMVGKPLMTGAEQEAAGINTFDIVSVTDAFATEHPELVRKFMEVTTTANVAFEAKPDAAYGKISIASGMDLDAVRKTMAGFSFPDVATQRSEKMMGGSMGAAAKGVAEVMKGSGSLERVLEDYRPFIDTSFLAEG